MGVAHRDPLVPDGTTRSVDRPAWPAVARAPPGVLDPVRASL